MKSDVSAFYTRLKGDFFSRPLPYLLALALVPRLIAALFSKGYGMTDDHYEVIEIAQSWITGLDFWLHDAKPALHSVVYPGLHYGLFRVLEALGIDDAQAKMYVVRFLHAFYSLLTVYFSYKITEKLSASTRMAIKVGLLVGLLWFLPFFSVRNLIEMVCVPFLLAGFYWLLKAEEKENTAAKLGFYAGAGLIFGLGFAFRYQSILFPFAAGCILLAQKKWTSALIFGISYGAGAMLLQGTADWAIWGRPFAAFMDYIKYNSTEYIHYPMTPWYSYLLTLSYLLIPPVSFFLLFGYAYTWRRYALLFWPSLLFFVFHSYYPNKQERFILPFIPFLLILGVMGWEAFRERSKWWSSRARLARRAERFFWTLNTILLFAFSLHYSKRAQVETMGLLGKQTDFRAAIIDHYDKPGMMVPQFYLNRRGWTTFYEFPEAKSPESLKREIEAKNVQPNYIILTGEQAFPTRKARLRRLYPNLVYFGRVEPSFLDWLIYKINPINLNQTCTIYKIVE